jgi:hypothetical protein
MKAAHAGVAAFADGIAESSCPIRSRHWPIPHGVKAGKGRAIGPGPKQLVGPAQSPAPARR